MRLLKYLPGSVLLFCVCIGSGCKDKNGPPGAGQYAYADKQMIQKLTQSADSTAGYQPDNAQSLYQEALTYSKKHNDVKSMSRILIRMGNVYTIKGMYDSALLCYTQCRELTAGQSSADSISMIQQLNNNLASIHLRLNNYEEALRLLMPIAKWAEGSNSYDLLPNIYANIGVALMNSDEDGKALLYFDKGIKAAQKTTQAQKLLIPIYVNQCQTLLNMGNIKQGKEICEKTLILLKQNPNPEIEVQAKYLLGTIYEQEADNTKAIETYEALMNMKNDLPGRLAPIARLGSLYRSNNDFKKAEACFNEVLSIATQTNSPFNQSGAYYDLSKVYEQAGNPAKALACMKQYLVLKDSVQSLEKMKAVSLMEVRFRTAEKDKELAENKLTIANQEAKLVRRNTVVAGTCIGALLLLGGGAYSYRNRQRHERQKYEIAVYQALAKGEEKERNRIARDLHDGIGGLLTTLKMQHKMMGKFAPGIMQNEIYGETEHLLDTTIQEVRKTAHNLMPELLLRHGLVEAVSLFCKSMQEDNSLEIDFQYYGLIQDLEESFQLAVYRIIQELVHNIVKHARATEALVQLSRHNEALDVTVEDNGTGMHLQQQEPGAGMGLKNVESRVKELNGKMHIKSASGEGTGVYIEFNLSRRSKY